MNTELQFGKMHTKKLSKKMLDSLSLKKLKTIAKKYKVSCFKKGTKICVKKSTLLTRLKKSRSINKILQMACKMKKTKSSRRVARYNYGSNSSGPFFNRTGMPYSLAERRYNDNLDKFKFMDHFPLQNTMKLDFSGPNKASRFGSYFR